MRRPIYFISVVSVLITIYLLGHNHFSTSEIELSSAKATGNGNTQTEENKAVISVKDDSELTYFYCENYLETFARHSDNWFRSEYENWGAFLDQGYSLDDVTLAIEHFGNSNFAADFRFNILKQHSVTAQVEKSATEQFYQLLPADLFDFANKNSVRIQRTIPSNAVANYMTLSEVEKTAALSALDVSIDDVAFYIAQENIADADISKLLTRINDVTEVLGYDKLEATNLLDYAAFYIRPQILSELLNRGAQVSADNYLGSTMEWALAALNYSYPTAKVKDAAEAVKLLQYHQAAARFDIKNESSVSGDFPRHFYDFDAAKILALKQNYALDLNGINASRAIKIQENRQALPLVQQLTAQKKQYLDQQLLQPDSTSLYQRCHERISSIKQQWRAENAGSILQRLAEQYSAQPTELEEQLATIDPVLVDLHYQLTAHRSPLHPSVLMPQLSPLLERGDIDAAIEIVKAQQLTKEEQNWLLLYMLSWDMRFFTPLQMSGLYLSEIPWHAFDKRFFSSNKMQSLIEQGANLSGTDDRGKSLLYYAVKMRDIELINYLQEHRYPFHPSGVGEDPLHVALFIEHRIYNADAIIPVVDVLMGFSPDIDQYHLARMALLRLYYPQVYHQIAAKYPQLAVGDTQALPLVKL